MSAGDVLVMYGAHNLVAHNLALFSISAIF
jgi:hypothetical protein